MLRRYPSVSVVIPVFNEQENLPFLYQRMIEALDNSGESYEFIFVDDGSRDASFAVLTELCERDHRVKIVRLRRNFGQTAALTAGFDNAKGDIVITMDADLQNDPVDIPRLIEKLNEGYDIVSGWRKDRKDALLTKTLPSKFSNRLASWLTGVELHDYGCTLKAYRREVLDQIHLYGELHRYIPAVASSIGVRVAEIEVRHHERKSGSSKYGAGRLVRGLFDIITVKLLLTYMTRPMQMFATLGMLMLMLGFLSGTATLLMKIFMSTDITGNPLLYVAMLTFITATQLISLGFLGEISLRTYHETQSKPIYVVQEMVNAREAA